MGYWEQNEKGNSFSSAEGKEMIWGDTPADIMGDALRAIITAFRQDMNRMPTKQEMQAGLLFSLTAALEEADEDL